MAKGVERQVPFLDGPLTDEQLWERWGGLKDEPERVDGPAAPTEAAAAVAA